MSPTNEQHQSTVVRNVQADIVRIIIPLLKKPLSYLNAAHVNDQVANARDDSLSVGAEEGASGAVSTGPQRDELPASTHREEVLVA